MKNDAADTRLDGKPVSANHTEPARSKPLVNWKYEKFVRLVVDGTDPREAYTIAGFVPNRANHNRLMAKAPIKARIDVLRRERELAARAARVPLDQVLDEMDRRGIVRIYDLFERNAAGILSVRNLEVVPVEVSLALLKALGEGFGIREK
jgi:hypothetical protein